VYRGENCDIVTVAPKEALTAVSFASNRWGFTGLRNDAVIEINPRLTTSYVGLRALAETNLAEALLHVALGDAIPNLAWRPGVVQFNADGTVQLHS
jgi:predicted ATP-grasp superfamily ATP-dependent carboligase